MLQSDYVAEGTIIGKSFLDNKLIGEYSGRLRQKDFGDQRLGEIWTTMISLHALGEEVSPVSVSSKLEADGRLGVCGGIGFILKLDDQVSASHAEECVKVIKASEKRRRIVSACEELADRARCNHELDRAVADHVASLLAEDADGGVVHHDLKETIGTAVEQIRERFNNKQSTAGVTTGYTELDEMLGGWLPGGLYICSAGTGRGKSALALNFMNAAVRNGSNVVYVSLEMEAIDLVKRLISIRACIDGKSVRSGNLNSNEIEMMLQGVKTLSADSPGSIIIDKPGLSISELMAELRKIHNNQTIDLCIIDYLQLITGESTYSREREVASISAGLVGLSKTFGCSVLALSQVNDSGQVRESRAVEHDATAIMRIDYEDPENAPFDLAPDVKLSVLKHRHGDTGSIPMTFMKTTQTFATRRSYD